MHILLVDDDDDYNFLHRREIRKVSVPSVVLTKDTAIEETLKWTVSTVSR